MKGFKCIAYITGIFVLAIPFFTPIFMAKGASLAWAAESSLTDKHQKSGINCAGCHKETPPNAKVPMAACFQCHGDYAKLAEKTKKLPQNPHASHLDDLECDKCHHVHKPSVDYCAQCHKFGFKVR
jgi:hypothetical protein